MQQVSENIFVETGFRGCNPGIVVVPGGVVMIDTPQRPSDAVAWREFVLSKGKPLYLIHTEAHVDHMVGDFFFPEATLIAHEGIRPRLNLTQDAIDQVKQRTAQIDPEGLSRLDHYNPPLPTITFSKHMTLHLGDRILRLINFPGHTTEETAVVIPEERVAFTGDNVVHRCQVFVQEGSPWQWLESLDEIAALDVDILVPGHGGVCEISYVPEMAGFIQEWIDVVQAAVDKGMSREEALASISLLDRYPVEHNRPEMGPMIQQLNVANIYDRIVSGRR
ncbi:MAG: MBL fold metallo-hydrolase [Chloroflexi bacterium]|nr:MBL fold metallo-hydrolase [Chloroflexota bacterium]